MDQDNDSITNNATINQNHENEYTPNLDLRDIDYTHNNPDTKYDEAANDRNTHNDNNEDIFAQFKNAFKSTVEKGKESANQIITKVQDPEFQRSLNSKLDNITKKTRESFERIKDSETTHKLKDNAKETYTKAKKSLSDRNELKTNLESLKIKAKDAYTTLDSEEFRSNLHKKLNDLITFNTYKQQNIHAEEKGIATDDIINKQNNDEENVPESSKQLPEENKPLLFNIDDEDIAGEIHAPEDKKYSKDNSFYEINSKANKKDDLKTKNDDSFSI